MKASLVPQDQTGSLKCFRVQCGRDLEGEAPHPTYVAVNLADMKISVNPTVELAIKSLEDDTGDSKEDQVDKKSLLEYFPNFAEVGTTISEFLLGAETKKEALKDALAVGINVTSICFLMKS